MISRAWVGLVVLAGCFGSHADDEGPPPPCSDTDGDGYGEGDGCRGPDCDEGAADRHDGCDQCVDGAIELCYGGPAGTAGIGLCRQGNRLCLDGAWGACRDSVEPAGEVCDGLDQDCDGDVDEGVLSACGDCDSGCRVTCAGVGCPVPIEPGAGAEALGDGSVRMVDGATDLGSHAIWIEDANDGLLMRLDATTYEVLGAYLVGSELARPRDVAVDARGDAFVCSDIEQPWVTRVDVDGCADVDGDGVLRTSTGRDDVLPMGEDDCVRWRVAIDGYDCALAVGIDGTLWVAYAYNLEGRIVPLDAATGDVGTIRVMSAVSRSALAARDGLWLGGMEDTVCHVDLDGENEECFVFPDQSSMTLDFDAAGNLLLGAPLAHFDLATEELSAIDAEIFDFTVDPSGRVFSLPAYVDGEPTELKRYDDNLLPLEPFPLVDSAIALTADLDGQIWTLSRELGTAAVYDSATGEHRATLFDDCPDECLRSSEIVGDPAGVRFRRTFPELVERAEAHAVLEAPCLESELRSWQSLSWESGDEGTIVLEVREASDRESLALQPWAPLATTPPATGSARLRFLEPQAALLEVRARFRGDAGELRRLELGWRCD